MRYEVVDFRTTQPNPDPTRTGLDFGSEFLIQYWIWDPNLDYKYCKYIYICNYINYTIFSCNIGYFYYI